jgi:hypothetical protein
LDISKMSDEKLALIARLAAHCILNGPVGIAKDTNFPTGEKGSIKLLLNVPVTNSSWRELCRKIAEAMLTVEVLKEACATCSQKVRHGAIWPLT